MSAPKMDGRIGRMGEVIATGLLLALIPCGAMATTPVARPTPSLLDEVQGTADATARMTVPVHINGKGPFAFIVDTGADRTVVSDRLATTLALRRRGTATLHSITGVDEVDTVTIDTLRVSTRETTDISAPALKEEHLGASGLLGIDSLSAQRVTLDFAGERMTIQPAERRPEPKAADEGDIIIVRARRKYGQLILTDAYVGGVKVKVVIDTGAQNSIGNGALRRRLARSGKAPVIVTLMDVTGGRTTAEVATIPDLKIGGLMLRHVPIAFADAHPFRQFGLSRTPAMLLGMDALRSMQRVSLDFQNRTVRFALRED